MNKLLVITGPTATGKTKLGIKLAKKFNGEIISADSRQVYKGMDVETGKDRSYFQWGIDILEPGTDFSVSDFVNYATKIIKDIQKRGKLPIVVGGSGQYIKELLNPSATLNIPPDRELRAKLAKYSVAQLQKLVNPPVGGKMNLSDWQNPRRLIRAVEISGQPGRRQKPKYNALVIGLTAPREILYKRIATRRRDRPDLIPKEFSLAKKQRIYMQKFLRPAWFDITSPVTHNEICHLVEEFVQPLTSKNKNTPNI